MRALNRNMTRMTLLAAFWMSGCAHIWDAPPSPEPLVVAEAAPIPQGTVAYCWEEPLVIVQDNGPGVDSSGNWYHPYYKAIREVRSGKWRPCRPGEREAEEGR